MRTTSFRAFNISQVYQYFTVYRRYFVLWLEQFIWISDTTLFKNRRYQAPFLAGKRTWYRLLLEGLPVLRITFARYALNRKIGMPNNLKYWEDETPKDLNRISKIYYDPLYLRFYVKFKQWKTTILNFHLLILFLTDLRRLLNILAPKYLYINKLFIFWLWVYSVTVTVYFRHTLFALN